MTRIFHSDTIHVGDKITLSDFAHAHVARALRLKAGDALSIFTGDNREYAAEITHTDKKSTQAKILNAQTVNRESPLQTHLLLAVSRGDKMDYALQKATELGVTEITPVLTERCGVKLNGERADKRGKHWQGVIIHACEQSGRNTLPVLHAVQPLATVLSSVHAELKLVLCFSEQALSWPTTLTSVAMLIGPEGGLTATEVELAEYAGFQLLTLGARVMRTETAPLAALAVLQQRYGDMN